MTPVFHDRSRWLAHHILPHEAGLRAWLGRRPLKNVDIDDVVQETYAIFAGLAQVDHIVSPRNYLFEVAKSVISRELRRARVIEMNDLIEFDALVLPSNDPTPENIAVARDELRRTEAVIETLPAKCREAFTLRKLHGISQREVARRMAISESTVEKHIGKALFALMDAMGRGRNSTETAPNEHDAGHRLEPRSSSGNQPRY